MTPIPNYVDLQIGYVFQSLNLPAGLSRVENVMLSGLLTAESGRTQQERAIAMLDQFGLASVTAMATVDRGL
jgi:predicted ABC-type transport system involved in lysophospholipase L1 biosynthesis ATPase subunit